MIVKNKNLEYYVSQMQSLEDLPLSHANNMSTILHAHICSW